MFGFIRSRSGVSRPNVVVTVRPSVRPSVCLRVAEMRVSSRSVGTATGDVKLAFVYLERNPAPPLPDRRYLARLCELASAMFVKHYRSAHGRVFGELSERERYRPRLYGQYWFGFRHGAVHPVLMDGLREPMYAVDRSTASQWRVGQRRRRHEGTPITYAGAGPDISKYTSRTVARPTERAGLLGAPE